MPRRKSPLKFKSEAHAVYYEVRQHFGAKGVELPQGWEALVAVECFPGQVLEQPLFTNAQGQPVGAWAATPFKEQNPVALDCYARDPTLARKILEFARHRVKRHHKQPARGQDVVRGFLLKHGCGSLAMEPGQKLRPLTLEEFKRALAGIEKYVKIVPVQNLTDDEIALFVDRRPAAWNPKGLGVSTGMVTKVRQSLGYDVVKGSVNVIPVNQLSDAEFAPYVESDPPATITPDILKQMRLLVPFVVEKRSKRTERGFELVPVRKLSDGDLKRCFEPCQIAAKAMQGLRLWEVFVRCPTKKRKSTRTG